MPVSADDFVVRAALESILYIACRLPNPTIHEVLKVRYAADRLHLATHGFMASGDRYVAMKFGPVASGTYNIMKAARGEASEFISQEMRDIVADGSLKVVDKSVQAARDAELDWIAPTDIVAIQQAIAEEGNLSFGVRTDRSHDEAWKSAWRTACKFGMAASHMPIVSIARTLPEHDALVEHLTK
jgi:hypothetical protein